MHSANVYKYNNSIESCCKYTGNHLKLGDFELLGWHGLIGWTIYIYISCLYFIYGNFEFFWVHSNHSVLPLEAGSIEALKA